MMIVNDVIIFIIKFTFISAYLHNIDIHKNIYNDRLKYCSFTCKKLLKAI